MTFRNLDKLVMYALMAVLVLTLAGCGSNSPTKEEPAATYQVIFEVTGEAEVAGNDPVALEGASVTLAGTEKTTSAEGVVSFDSVSGGNKNFTITAAGYEDLSGTINVNDNLNVKKTLTLKSVDNVYEEVNKENIIDRLVRVNTGLDLDEVEGNITLPATIETTEGTSTITWASDNTDVIDNQGNVTRPTPEDGAQEVTLTATVDGADYEIVVTVLPLSIIESISTISATNDPDFELTIEVVFSQAVDNERNAGISTQGSARIDSVVLSDDNKTATVIVKGYPFDSELDFSGVKLNGQNINANNWEIDTLDLEKPHIQLSVDDDELVIHSDGANDVALITAELVGFPVSAEAEIDFTTEFGSLYVQQTEGKKTDATFVPKNLSTNQTAIVKAQISNIKGLSGTSVDITPYTNIQSTVNIKISLAEEDEETGIEYIHYYLKIDKAVSTQADRIYVDFSRIENNDIGVLELLEPDDFIVWDNAFINPAEIDVEKIVPDPEKKNRVILLLDGPDNNVVDGIGDSFDTDFPLTDNTTHKVELSSELVHIIPAEEEGELDYKIIFEESEAVFKLEDVTYPSISKVCNYEYSGNDIDIEKYNLAKNELLVVFTEAPNALPVNTAEGADKSNSIYNLDNWILDGCSLGDKDKYPGYDEENQLTNVKVSDEPYVEMRLLSTDGDDPTTGINKDAVVISITDNNGTRDGDTYHGWGDNRVKFLKKEDNSSGGDHDLQVTSLGDWASVTDSKNIIASQSLKYSGIEIDEVELALIVDNSPEQFIIAFNEPVYVSPEDMEIQLGDVAGDGELVPYMDGEGNPLFTVSSIVPDQVFLIEMNQDWGSYHNVKTSKIDYYSSSKNPIKILVSGIENFWGESVTIESNEYILRADFDSPEKLLAQPLTTVIGEEEAIDLESIDIDVDFPHPGEDNVRIDSSDISSMFPFIDFDDIVYDLELASTEAMDYPEAEKEGETPPSPTNLIADAGAMLIIMNEPVQWADKNYKNEDSIHSNTLTPPSGKFDDVNISTFIYRMTKDAFGNDVKEEISIPGIFAEVGFRDYYALVNPETELEAGTWQFVHQDTVDDANNSFDTTKFTFVVTDSESQDLEAEPLPFELLGVDTIIGEGSDPDLIRILFTHKLKNTGINSALTFDHYRINGEEIPQGKSSIEFGIEGDTDRYIGVVNEEILEGSEVYREKIMILTKNQYDTVLSTEEKGLFEPINSSEKAITITLPNGTLQKDGNNMITIVKNANAAGALNPESGTEVYPNTRVDIPYGISISRVDSLYGSSSSTGEYLLFAPDGDFSVDYSNTDPFGSEWTYDSGTGTGTGTGGDTGTSE